MECKLPKPPLYIYLCSLSSYKFWFPSKYIPFQGSILEPAIQHLYCSISFSYLNSVLLCFSILQAFFLLKMTSNMTGTHKQTEEILRTWLHNVGFDLQQAVRPFHTKLYTELEEWILSRNLQEHQLSCIWKLLPTCTSAAGKWYPHASHQLKQYIALYTTFLLYVDDKAEQDLEHILLDLRRVSSGAHKGLHTSKCDDTVIDMWLELVATETGTFYGPYSTGVITKGLVDFMLENIVEADVAVALKLPAEFGQRASKFVRDKTGAGEVYAHSIFPGRLAEENGHLPTYVPFIACMLDIIDDVNDILSFLLSLVELSLGLQMYYSQRMRLKTIKR